VPPIVATFMIAAAGCGGPADTGPSTPSTTVAIPTTAATTPVVPTSATPAGPTPQDPTTDNPIDAGAGLGRVLCGLPAWPDNDADLATFFTVAVGCLDRAWRKVMITRRLPFEPAKVVLTENLPTPAASQRQDVDCARPPENDSFYCDDTIYLDQDSYLSTTTGPKGVPAAAIALIGHEYGHHIQRLSGLLPEAVFRIGLAGPDTPAGLELSRCVELQAECFAGMFLGATFDPAGVTLAEHDAAARGDLPNGRPDHGTPKTYGGWFTQGAHANSLTACDTWSAPPSAVR